MLNDSQNDTQVIARIPSHIKKTLQKAADLSGATLNQFIVQAALKEAHNVLESERVITLSEQDADLVFSLIENPPAPNAHIKAAAEKHKAFFNENH